MSSLEGHELRPYHVVVSDEYQHLVEESLLAISFRRRPKLKPGVGRSLLVDASPDTHAQDVFDDFPMTLEPVRTFLCCVHDLYSASSVVQSTVEHYGATTNPRRYVI